MSEPLVDYQACQIRVALIKQEVDNFRTFFDRLDSAIEKIGTVSTDIKQMLAVHEEKIVVMDEKIAHNKQNAIMAQDSFREDIKELHSRITTVNRELSANLITTETKIIDKQNTAETRIIAGQEDLKKYFIASHEALEKRVKTLENWRYILVGIFLVIGAIAGFVANNSIHIGQMTP